MGIPLPFVAMFYILVFSEWIYLLNFLRHDLSYFIHKNAMYFSVIFRGL